MKTKQIKPIKDCCFKNIDKAIRIGRCNYICPKCKKDVSLLWFYYQQALDKDKPKSLLGTSKMIIKKGKPTII